MKISTKLLHHITFLDMSKGAGEHNCKFIQGLDTQDKTDQNKQGETILV